MSQNAPVTTLPNGLKPLATGTAAKVTAQAADGTIGSLSLGSGSQGGTGTAVAVAGAATLNQPAGSVTSEALSTATTYTLTLANSYIKAGSVVLVNVTESTHAAAVSLLSKAITNGQIVVGVSMASLTGTLQFDFAVFN